MLKIRIKIKSAYLKISHTSKNLRFESLFKILTLLIVIVIIIIIINNYYNIYADWRLLKYTLLIY